ncbi:unnamed protein product [Rhizophagus irregularis]|uniref:Uncharacterized protein n=1 Tax=Rhizophagus irregularis TaxID=588596 RepID=A0A915ZMV5_9GLOM|nr:unnamed protein product [Rhizophagus irregularis]
MTRKYNNSSRSERDRNRYRSKSRTYHRKSKSHRKYSRDRNRRSRSSSYDNSKNRSRRPRRSKHNRQDDKVKGLFEEFLKNKLNEPSNTNHELEYLEGRDQTSQEDQDHTRSQSRTQEEDQDRTRSQSRTQEEDQDRTRSQSRTQEDQDLTRSQSRTQKDQGRTRSQSRTQEKAQDHTRSQSRTQEDQGRTRSQSRTQKDQGRTRGQSRTREGQGRSRGQSRTRKVGVILEANPELGKVRVILEVNPELGRIGVVLEPNQLRTQSTSSSNLSHNDPKYIHINDLPQDLRNAVKRQIFWIVDRIPTKEQLKLDETFDSQQNLVNNTIVPTIMKTLDLDMYPISEAIVYDMIHNRHKYQREEFLKKQKETSFQDEQARRKHMNSRRNDLRYFLRDYIDRIFSESSKVSKKRTQIHDSVNFYDKEWTKPFQAPNWTISGYTGSLKMAVQKACMKRFSNTLPARV